jgi:hypothetical protein
MKTKAALYWNSTTSTLSGFVAVAVLLFGTGPRAMGDDDSSSDAPVGFAAIAGTAKGVILRVPVNANGEENTDGAEMRFHRGGPNSLSSGTVVSVWDKGIKAAEDDILLGKNGPAVNPNGDSSTWGWYRWYWNGWMYPYYYTWYRPTFYYYNHLYSYPNYSYWTYNTYRYYYYWYW